MKVLLVEVMIFYFYKMQKPDLKSAIEKSKLALDWT
jgi:hypothetical protein